MKFNKDKGLLDQITKIDSEKEATEFKESYIEYILKDNKDIKGNRKEAITIANSNIGYLAGYCAEKTRNRIHKLFKADHPIFGASY